MNSLSKYDVAVIGGGPAGATASIYLKRYGFNVCLIEKRAFPRETLCGEFISKEVVNILHELDLWQEFLALNPNPISFLRFIDDKGHELKKKLGFTGYGIKRGKFDRLLLNEAKALGVEVFQPVEVKNIFKGKGLYSLSVLSKDKKVTEITSEKVIAGYGKQNQLDRQLNRSCAGVRSGLNGIKFHVPLSLCPNISECEIQIYTSKGIYCGVNTVDDDIVTVCFLEDHNFFPGTSREHLKSLLQNNTALKNLFEASIDEFIDCAPVYGIGNIFFDKKSLTENGIIMIGDAARVIAPLAGDGIAMAMQSARIASDILSRNFRASDSRIVKLYESVWKNKFNSRVILARILQKIILNGGPPGPFFTFTKMMPFILNYIIRSTRG